VVRSDSGHDGAGNSCRPSARLSDRLGARLTALARQHRVPGAQLAVHHRGETVTVQTGVEHHTGGRPMTAASRVPIGSITKACTATVAMILVSDGDLELDAPIGDVLPELRGNAAAGQLTARQLLSHTSGLPSDPGEDATSLRRGLDGVTPSTLVCVPGEEFSYSNIGYALVGRLVEVTTGMSWREAVCAILLDPIGIEPIFIGGSGPEPTVAGHASGSRSGVRAVEQVLPPVLAPAGGLALSARDLAAVGRLHLSAPTLLDAETASEMHRAVPAAEPFGLADGWTLGLASFRGLDGDWLGHDGTADGTSCHLRIDREGECVVALTANAGTGTALWRSVVEELRSEGFPIADYRTGNRSGDRVPVPAEYFARYRNGGVEYSVVHGSDGAAAMAVDGEVFHGLTLYDGGAFSVLDPESLTPADCGRFFRDRRTGAPAIQVGGRIARLAC
jgi:CubicO group peptidase (beta-lactamase class C family)